MKELLWQLKKDKWVYLILMLLFGGCLIPFFVIVSEDNVPEAVYRLLIMFLGMCALFLYGERGRILRKKEPGAAFYHSMPESLKKERKRLLVLDVFFFATATVVFLLYRAVCVLVSDCFDGRGIYVGLLLYLVCMQLLARHPYLILCVTMLSLVMLGMGNAFTLPLWAVAAGVVICVTGMLLHYHRLEKIWTEE